MPAFGTSASFKAGRRTNSFRPWATTKKRTSIGEKHDVYQLSPFTVAFYSWITSPPSLHCCICTQTHTRACEICIFHYIIKRPSKLSCVYGRTPSHAHLPSSLPWEAENASGSFIQLSNHSWDDVTLDQSISCCFFNDEFSLSVQKCYHDQSQ